MGKKFFLLGVEIHFLVLSKIHLKQGFVCVCVFGKKKSFLLVMGIHFSFYRMKEMKWRGHLPLRMPFNQDTLRAENI